MWVSWSVMWCNAADAAADDDAFAVALPGSPHTGNPCLVCSLISSILQHSSTGRDMHEWHSSMLHPCSLAITLLMPEFLLAHASPHRCMHVWDFMLTFHLSFKRHIELMLLLTPCYQRIQACRANGLLFICVCLCMGVMPKTLELLLQSLNSPQSCLWFCVMFFHAGK